LEPDGGTANICHGEAGRLAILLRFAHDTDVPGINLGINAAVDRVCAHYDSRHTFGFKDQAAPDTCTDDPGFLNGAAGICMALAAAVTPNTPEWDQVLLIS
jgi:lantibiotic modifying enzyme